MKPSPVLLAHGGAGGKRMTPAQGECLRLALMTGHNRLRRGASALDVVEQTIRILESSGLFNAGMGSRLQLDGVRRMDAALMEGRTLRAGAVAGIEDIRHPISAARLVMEKTSHVLIVGAQATRLARRFKLDRQAPPTIDQRRRLQAVVPTTARQRKTLLLHLAVRRCETVGAVARDRNGNLASGASTGGIPFMLPGRVGDTPLIGCGIFADNEAGAVSMTGIGESIIRLVMAKDIATRLAAGRTAATAARQAIHQLVQRIAVPADTGVGVLVLAPSGKFAISHSSRNMAAGYWTGKGDPVVADKFT
jgi:L-asparaginase / beta-aspartyl-peptidase